jgi:SPP1 gp7 family putative phage head morphogenesis protein
MQSKDYWIKRALQREADAYQSTGDTIRRLRAIYDMATARLTRVVRTILVNYMKSSGVDSEKDAKKVLSVQETAETLAALREEYAKTGSIEALAKLNAPAYVYRISRAQAIRKAIDAETEWLNEKESQAGAQRLAETYDAAYYKTMHDTAKAAEQDIAFTPLPQHSITEALENRWKGENYSERVWKNTHLVAKEAGKIIDEGLTSGATVAQMTHDIMDLFDVGYYAAARLVRTEVNRMHNDATVKSYKAMGVEEYTFLATLDARTCVHCGVLDGKHFKVNEARTGVNLPPLHPNDRCTTVAYYPGEDISGTRTARNPETGKNYKVDRHMTYEQWRKEVGTEELEKAQQIIANRAADAVQYNQYCSVLGKKNMPMSFSEFQGLKYGNPQEWGILKTQYRGMGYYKKVVQNEPAITETIKNTAEKIDMTPAGLEHRIKEKGSYLDKIRRKYKPGDNNYEVKDILRYTFTATPKELVNKTLQSIDELGKNGYTTIAVKNSWNNKMNPYKGVNTIIRAPNGQGFELQYHTPDSFVMKEKIHPLYEQWREMPNKASPEAVALMRKMKVLSAALQMPDDIEKVR